MTDMIADSLCSLINRTFPRLVDFISGASGGAVVAAALGIVIAFVLSYKGLQAALDGAQRPTRRKTKQRARRVSWLSDDDVYDAEWMNYELWQEK